VSYLLEFSFLSVNNVVQYPHLDVICLLEEEEVRIFVFDARIKYEKVSLLSFFFF
jgi:hypothetical protein